MAFLTILSTFLASLSFEPAHPSEPFSHFSPEGGPARERDGFLGIAPSREEAENLVSVVHELWEPVALGAGDRKLEIQIRWQDNALDARAGRRGRTADVVITGGMVSNPVMTIDSLAMILCHELGHLYGGEPYKTRERGPGGPGIPGGPGGAGAISAEGQADYYGARECLPRVIERISFTPENIDPAAPGLCAGHANAQLCERMMEAVVNNGRVFGVLAESRGRPANVPSLAFSDPAVARETNTGGYPSHQCRLDTMRNAILGRERPACWYADGERPESGHRPNPAPQPVPAPDPNPEPYPDPYPAPVTGPVVPPQPAPNPQLVPGSDSAYFFSPQEIEQIRVFRVIPPGINCRREPSTSAQVMHSFGGGALITARTSRPTQDGKVWMHVQQGCWVAANRSLLESGRR